jgi:hypothetical protein
MIWTTAQETFTSRNQWTIESVLKQHPCAAISVYSNTLPLNVFKTLMDFGFNVKVVRYDFSKIVKVDEPGYKWALETPRYVDFPHYHIHTSDMLRLLLLFKHGGSYVDMDHVTTGPILGVRGPGRNIFGGERCRSDNPDCLGAKELLQLNVIRAEHIDSANHMNRAGFHTVKSGDTPRYTPCNGLLLNWDANHPVIAAALREIDSNYDPHCWGCLGPRLFGKLMYDTLALPTTVRRKNIFEDVSLLPPGVLYPIDYSEIASILGPTRRYEVEHFMANTYSLGVHFYGKMTNGLKIQSGSTMEKIIHEATVFGKVRMQRGVYRRRA